MTNKKNHKGVFILFSVILASGIFSVYAVAIVFGQEGTLSQNQAATVPGGIALSCGTSNGGTFTVRPTENLCVNGVASSVILDSSLWRWKCAAASVASLNPVACSATHVPTVETTAPSAINGKCGSAGGAFFASAPTENLCTSGEKTAITANATGGWSWSCKGLNGGTDASCLANKKVAEGSSYVMPDFLNEITGTLKGKIVEPRNYAVISEDKFVAQISVENASSVELYAKRSGLSQELYLGKGVDDGNNKWVLEKNISNYLPNGSYSLIARISNQDGSIDSDVVYFKVDLASRKSQILEESDISNDPAADSVGNEIPEQMGVTEIGKEVENEKDSDQDGLLDKDEITIGTNPFDPDTDGDGYLDGDEVKNGYDPRKFSPGDGSDKIIFQSPKEKGDVDGKYLVSSVELLKGEKSEGNAAVAGDVLKLSGRALPEAFVTLYIFSNDPIVVIIKTDANGNWVYELDKDLENGDHEAYVAITDNTGRITAKSEPFYFVKTAEAANVITSAQANERKQVVKSSSPIEESRGNFIAVAVAIAVVFVSVALAMIGMVTYKHREQ